MMIANKVILITLTSMQVGSSNMLNWSFSTESGDTYANEGTGQKLTKRHPGTITYRLDDDSAKNFSFTSCNIICPITFPNGVGGQIGAPTSDPRNVSFYDSNSSKMSIHFYLTVQDQNGSIYNSPDPEIDNDGDPQTGP